MASKNVWRLTIQDVDGKLIEMFAFDDELFKVVIEEWQQKKISGGMLDIASISNTMDRTDVRFCIAAEDVRSMSLCEMY